MTVKAPAVAWGAWAVALAWSSGLLAFRVRPYLRDGSGVLVPLAVPLLITLLVGLTLLLSRRRGAFTWAWSLTVLLIVLNALALLTIGIVVVPATAALIATCALWGILGKELESGGATPIEPNSAK